MKKTWLMAAGGALLSTAALAQPAATHPAATPPASQPTMAPGAVQRKISADLTASGFTDVRVVPDSFLVEAKDKSGQPITMVINPHSITEVVGGSTGQGSTSQAGNQGAAQNMGSGAFTTVATNDKLSSKLVGTDVCNDENKKIGSISDIAYQNGAIKAYIVGVGGFLGMGEHDVAVRPSAMQVSWNDQAKAWHAQMNTTVADLKAAPEFTPTHKG